MGDQKKMMTTLGKMNRIRVDAAVGNNMPLDDAKKDRYLALAKELAVELNGLEDDSFTKKLKKFSALSIDERFIDYDVSKDYYWQQNYPDFARTLDDVVISGLGDALSSTDDKHHVFQALKFMTTGDKKFEDKEEIFDTIVPYQKKPVAFRTGLVRGLLGKMFGTTYKVIEKNDLEVEFECDAPRVSSRDQLTRLMDISKKAGYESMIVNMSDIDLGIAQHRQKAELIGERKRGRLLGIGYDKEKIRNFWRKSLDRTFFVSAPVLGCLSAKTKEKLFRYIYNKGEDEVDNQRRATSLSGTYLGLGGLGLGIYSVITNQPALVVLGCYLITESGYRLSEQIKKRTCPGTIPGVVLGNLARKAIEFRNRYRPEYRARINLGKQEYNPIKARNPKVFDDLQRASLIELSEDAEKNLIWSEGNHNQFATLFTKELLEKEHNIANDYETIRDKKNQLMCFYSLQNIGDYKKFTSLYCSSGKRYVLSLLSRNGDFSAENIPMLSEILADSSDAEEKARKIAGRFKLRYTHLAAAESGKIIGDYVIK